MKSDKTLLLLQERMVQKYGKSNVIELFTIGDIVSLRIPALDRGDSDDKRIFAKAIDIPRNNRFQLATAHGVLDTLYRTSDLNQLDDTPASTLNINWDENTANKLSLHTAAARNSTTNRVALSCSCRK